MSDQIDELVRILCEVGARVTLDPDRSTAAPCVICRTTDRPRDLITIGTYTRRMGGNIRPGDRIDRPMCFECQELTDDAKTPAVPCTTEDHDWTSNPAASKPWARIVCEKCFQVLRDRVDTSEVLP